VWWFASFTGSGCTLKTAFQCGGGTPTNVRSRRRLECFLRDDDSDLCPAEFHLRFAGALYQHRLRVRLFQREY
jgi:hypothetical protein